MSEPEGATPLKPEEKEDLIPDIQSREELNEWEQNNILEAERWLFSSRRSLDRILNVTFIRSLHEKMFEHVWEWAGQFRDSERNIGIDPRQISVECKKLCENAAYWIEEETHEPLETFARLHHRLTVIHPFPNGNGRHARLFVDYLSYYNDDTRFSWGGKNLVNEGNIRERYIQSLRKADRGDFKPLLDFMRSS